MSYQVTYDKNITTNPASAFSINGLSISAAGTVGPTGVKASYLQNELVDATTPTDKQLLIYDGMSSQWQSSNSITNLPTPTNPSDAANKSYVDAATTGINIHTDVASGTITPLNTIYTPGSADMSGGFGIGATLTNNGTQEYFTTDPVSTTVDIGSDTAVLPDTSPSPPLDTLYVTSTTGFENNGFLIVNGNMLIQYMGKTSNTFTNCTTASTGILSTGQTVVSTFAIGTRILVKNQTNQIENGVYTVTDIGSPSTNWVLTRANDFDNSVVGQVTAGDFVFICCGPTLANTGYVQTYVGTGVGNVIIIGTDPIVFTQFSGAGTYIGGTGINISGNLITNTGVLSVSGGTSGLTFSPSMGNSIISGVLNPSNGGTGVNNGLSTITLSDNFTTSGAFPITLTATGITNITLPTSGTLSNNTLPDGNIFVGNGSNIAANVAMSGDATITNTGVVTVVSLQGNIPIVYAGSNKGFSIGLLNTLGGNTTGLCLGIACQETGGGFAIGNVNTASNGLAFGGSNISGNNCIAVGYGNNATVGSYNVGIGNNNNLGVNLANTSTAIGYGNSINTGGNGNVAIGYNNTIGSTGTSAIAIGQGITANGTNSIMIGQNGITNGVGSIAIGNGAGATGTGSIALGQGASNTVANTAVITASGNEIFRTLDPAIGNHSYKLYKHTSGDSATITNVTGNGTTVTYTAINTFIAGQTVSITGTVTSSGPGTPNQYNLTSVVITSADQNSFSITNPATGLYTSGGTATTVAASAITLSAAVALGGYFEASFAGAITITMDTGVNLDANAQLNGNLYVGQSFKCVVVASNAAGVITFSGASGVTIKGLTVTSPNASVELLFYRKRNASWDVSISAVSISTDQLITTLTSGILFPTFVAGTGLQPVRINQAQFAIDASTGALQLGSTGIAVGQVGGAASASGTNSIAIGNLTFANNQYTISIGDGTYAEGPYSVSIGYNAYISTNADASVSIGKYSYCGSTNAVVIGESAYVGNSSNGAVSIGNNASINGGIGSVSIGLDSRVFGDNGVAIGHNVRANNNSISLGFNIPGGNIDNVVIGTAPNLTTGFANVIVCQSGPSISSGTYNVLMGYDINCASNSNNTIVIGISSIVVGTYGIVIGSNSGNIANTGVGNILIGSRIMENPSTGAYNTAVGNAALATQPGDNNTVIGFQSGYTISGGSNNTCAGFQAGYSITSGNGNTLLGYQADCGGTVTNAIAIGSNAIASATGGVAIGNGITANQTNGMFMRHRGPIAQSVNPAGFIAGTNELVEIPYSSLTPTNVSTNIPALVIPNNFNASQKGVPIGGLYRSANNGATSSSTFSITGSFVAAGTTLTVSPVPGGFITPGMFLTGGTVTSGTQILSQLTGPAGGDGTYQVDTAQLIGVTTTGVIYNSIVNGDIIYVRTV